MTVSDLELLYDYSYWANAQSFAVVSQLSSEQFTQSVGGSYGSVRNTTVHMLSAEWGWLDRCGGAKRGPALVASDYPTATSVIERWTQVECDVRDFLSKLRDDDLNRNIDFVLGTGARRSMPLGQLLHHAANHSVHHRGQLALLLRTLGFAPGNFDLLIYFEQESARQRTSLA